MDQVMNGNIPFVRLYLLSVDTVRRLNLSPVYERMPKRAARAGRFYHEKDRLLCLGGGLLMLNVLRIPDETVLQYGPNEKPFAPGYPAFNLSHSGEWCAFAAAFAGRGGSVGSEGSIGSSGRKVPVNRMNKSHFYEENFLFSEDKYLLKEDKFLSSENKFLTREDKFLTEEDNFIYGEENFLTEEDGFLSEKDMFPLEEEKFPLGADIEEIEEKNLSVAHAVYTPEELIWMREDPDKEVIRFHQLWTWKESLMKAVGKGLSLAPKSFSVLPFTERKPVSLFGRQWYALDGVLSSGMERYCWSVCAPEPFSCEQILLTVSPRRMLVT